MRIRKPAVLASILLVAACGQAPDQAGQATQTRADLPVLGGHPDLNGIWQALGTAHWNVEAHSAEAIDQAWSLGAIAAIPAGNTVITRTGKASANSVPAVTAMLGETLGQVAAELVRWALQFPAPSLAK